MNVNDIITSKDNKHIKYLLKLKNIKFSEKEKCFITFNKDLIDIANKNKLLKIVYLTSKENKYENEVIISNDLMLNLNNKSNIVGVINYLNETKINEKKIIYLDEIRDPLNLAKIIYLMHKFDYKRLILSPNSVSIYNLKCLEEISSLIFNINISYGDINTLKELKDKGYYLYSTGLRNATYLSDIKKIEMPYVLIFGNEARGINQKILEISNEVIKIEMSNMESLNIAVAASIIFNSIK